MSIGNTIVRPQSSSGIYTISSNAPTDVLEALKSELSIPIKQAIPDTESATSTTDILVILCEDFSE